MLHKFYTKTKYFWIVSRIVMILVFSAAILNRITESDIANIIVNALFVLFILSMIIIAVFEILKKEVHYSLNFMVGIFMFLFGIMISYLILTFSKPEYELLIEISFQVVPIWIILYGIYELINGVNSLKTIRN